MFAISTITRIEILKLRTKNALITDRSCFQRLVAKFALINLQNIGSISLLDFKSQFLRRFSAGLSLLALESLVYLEVLLLGEF